MLGKKGGLVILEDKRDSRCGCMMRLDGNDARAWWICLGSLRGLLDDVAMLCGRNEEAKATIGEIPSDFWRPPAGFFWEKPLAERGQM